MNKKNNRKGFTTVELVIVIAVIAILATVLIPTFSNLIGKANESAALQAANSIFKNYFIDKADETNAAKDFYIEANGYYFQVDDGELIKEPVSTVPGGATIITAADSEPFYSSATAPTETPSNS